MSKKPGTIEREEGERIAQAMFTFMGYVRGLYGPEARAVAIRIIEAEAKAESDPVEKAFFEVAVAWIKQVDATQAAAMRAAYGQ